MVRSENHVKTVLSVAFPLFPVSVDSAGGAEQILYLLDRELVRLGHRSIVIAMDGSEVSGQLIPTPAISGPLTPEIHRRAQAYYQSAITEAIRAYRPDIVHYHGLDFDTYISPNHAKQIASMHLPLEWYSNGAYDAPDVRLCCVSKSQGRTVPQGIDVRVVSNGIDTDRFSEMNGAKRGNYILWLGRVCPEKAVHVALQIAHELDLPAIIAGPVHGFAEHESYFEQQVRPLLDDRRIYVGPVGFEEKRDLLSRARCLAVTSVVPETSSLVAMEALAAGTPVIASNCGALPEVIDDGVTGFIVNSQSDFEQAVLRTDEISPTACRSEARRRFSVARMCADYLAVYDE